MQRIHIVGRKNHGKTTLMVALIEEFGRRGLAVGSIKHSSHDHDLDTPGKDSYRHRAAGSDPAAIVTPELVGVFLQRPAGEEVYERLRPLFEDCPFVLVEGDIDADGLKVEVWRSAVGGKCLAVERDDILAVISDDLPDAPVPVWSRRGVERLADRLLQLLGDPAPAAAVLAGCA